jgi:hypothetical protein
MNEIQFFDKATLPEEVRIPTPSLLKVKLNKQNMPSATQVGFIFIIFCIIFLIIRYRNKQGIVYKQQLTRHQQYIQLNATQQHMGHMDQMIQADKLRQTQQLEAQEAAEKIIIAKEEKKRDSLESFSFANF